MIAAAVVLGGFAIAVWAQPPSSAGPVPAAAATVAATATAQSGAADPKLEEGRELFEESCSSCHGFKGEGVKGQAPSLIDAGEGAADFYLRTGRMPLDQVGDEPLRGEPRYSNAQIQALDAYVGSLGEGPPIPAVDPSRGSVREGMEMFTESCAGCHGIGGKGGVAIGGYAPPLGEATPTQVGEAIRVGPYLMPRFSESQITPAQLNSIARYVELTQHPEDAGGFGIGHIGPVPEGLVAWLAALAALLLVARLIGEGLGGSRADDDAEEPR
ncbi:MAG TPA: c-type cytochrome [Solirubrobacterales bacterium]|jgi:ubiquinol-cytochrome c reductase cytochrome c subunit|nr:c-type cytochrome [Solirubrobacterales bacterium]